MRGVDLLASAIPTDPSTYETGLSMEMVAALRQAWDSGIPLVNVVAFLSATGYELRIIPAEDPTRAKEEDYQFAALAGIPAPEDTPPATLMEVARATVADALGLEKGISFEVENRIIARNRKRKTAQAEHPFKRARWVTRDGRARCVTCGSAQTDSDTCFGLAAITKADTYTPPQGVQDAAARAVAWIRDGKAGDGFTAVGRKRASDLSAGNPVSVDTIRRMASYFARHEVDRRATGFNAGEDGYPTPGRVAWDAWGGDAGRTWANRIMDSLEKGDPTSSDVHVDTIMQPTRQRRRRATRTAGNPATMSKDDGDMEDTEPLTDRQEAMEDVYELIAAAYGQWDQGSGPDGAHYMSAADNPFAREGLRCDSCCFWEDGLCEIVSGEVEPAGLCKLWIIPDAEAMPEEEPMDWAQMLGAFSKATTEQRYTLGPLYVPDFVDAHGEWTDAESLQAGVWDYVKSGDRRIRLQHNREVVAGEWVECMAWPYEVTVPMTNQETGKATKVTFPPNTVFLGVIWEPWAWELVRTGKLRGYSIGGRAERVLADLPDQSGAAA